MTTANSMRKIGKGILKEIPEGFGFTLLVYPKTKKGIASSISTGSIQDMILDLRNTAEKLERNEFLPSTEEN